MCCFLKPPAIDAALEKTVYPKDLESQVKSLANPTDKVISVLANVSALLYGILTDINWLGFYLLDGKTLILGPFQGKPACVSIPVGKGVCGTAAKTRKPVLVHDVSTFDGHIACDPDSKSELVIPFFVKKRLFGVLDIDSAHWDRFDETDLKELKKALSGLESGLSALSDLSF